MMTSQQSTTRTSLSSSGANLLWVWLVSMSFYPMATGQSICGDCNADGAVSILDALRAAQHSAGIFQLDPESARLCDANSDWDVDIVDAFLIAQHSLSGQPPLSCPPPPHEWTLIPVATSPIERFRSGLIYWPDTQEIHLFSGANWTLGYQADMWSYDGANWMQLFPPELPPTGGCNLFVMDTARNEGVLLAGRSGACPLYVETWIWDGARWTRRFPAANPESRDGDSALAYDRFRQRTVLFSGTTACSGIPNDTWEWDGVDWTKRFPVSRPTPPRSGAKMAFSSVAGGLVLFGGSDYGTFLRYDETWLWDGVNWTQLMTSTSPPARNDFAMSENALTGEILIFGGLDSMSDYLDDTWIFDGVTWTLAHPTLHPSFRYEPGIAFDAFRSVHVLFGGFAGPPTYSSSDETWEY